LLFSHALEEGSLNFRTGTINFICQEYVRKYWTMHEVKLPTFGVEDIYSEHIPRQEVGGKLNAPKLHNVVVCFAVSGSSAIWRNKSAQGFGESCLPGAGVIFQKYVSVSK
jgi:hypothetical protein